MWGPEDTSKYIIGAGFGVALTVGIDIVRKYFDRQDFKTQTATALFHELCDRTTRCSYDYGFPFFKYAYPKKHKIRKIDDIVKFSPTSPLAFPSTVDKLGIFPANVSASLIVFYSALERWRQELDLTTKVFDVSADIPANYMHRLSRRLGETLAPAVDAIDALAPLVPNSALIEIDYFNAYYKHSISGLQRQQTELRKSLVNMAALAAESKAQERIDSQRVAL